MIGWPGAEEWNVLVPLALALGLDFYLVVLVIALLPGVAGLEGLPGSLELLSTTPAVTAAAFLYLFGWGMERHRFSLLLWQGANLIVRVVGTALIATFIVEGSGAGGMTAAAVLAGALAGCVQALRMGWGTVLDHGRGPIPRRFFRAAAEDAFAVGSLWVAFVAPPPWGLIGAFTLLVLVLSGSRPALRAATFSFPLLRGVALSVGGGMGWHQPDRFPRWLRRTLARASDPLSHGLRGSPAALSGGSGIGAFRTGWLVILGDGPSFYFRTPTRVWEAALAHAFVASAERRSDLILLTFEDGDRLMVPRGGPGLDAVRAEFAPQNL